MNSDLKSPLIQLALAIVAILVGLAVSRFRDYSLTDDLRLVWPSLRQALFWLGLWILWVAATEVISRELGWSRPSRWEDQGLGIIILRVVTLVIVAPFAEEFIFRGLLYYRISATRLGALGAIVIAAGIFAALHLQYRRDQAALIFLDGLVLGLALYSSDSLVVPILMHAVGNLYAVYQRLPDSIFRG